MPISYAYTNGRCLGSAGHGAAGNGHLGLQTAGDTEKSLTVQWEGGDLMYKCLDWYNIYICRYYYVCMYILYIYILLLCIYIYLLTYAWKMSFQFLAVTVPGWWTKKMIIWLTGCYNICVIWGQWSLLEVNQCKSSIVEDLVLISPPVYNCHHIFDSKYVRCRGG